MNEDTLTYNLLQLVVTYGQYENNQELIDTVKEIKKELFPHSGQAKNTDDVPF